MNDFDRPMKLSGATQKVKTPYGNVYVTMNKDHLGDICEVFITIGKAGSEIVAQTECIARLISIMLQSVGSSGRKAMASEIAQSLMGIGGGRQIADGDKIVKSLPDAIGIAIDAEIAREHALAAIETP